MALRCGSPAELNVVQAAPFQYATIAFPETPDPNGPTAQALLDD